MPSPLIFRAEEIKSTPLNGSGISKALYLEQHFANDIGEPNFIPYLLVHEYEALLFCGPTKFADWIEGAGATTIAQLQQITSSVPSPEDINDSPQTAPSKRISALLPRYQKTLHGPLIAEDIGLDCIRQQCPHFDDWLTRLEALLQVAMAK